MVKLESTFATLRQELKMQCLNIYAKSLLAKHNWDTFTHLTMQCIKKQIENFFPLRILFVSVLYVFIRVKFQGFLCSFDFLSDALLRCLQ